MCGNDCQCDSGHKGKHSCQPYESTHIDDETLNWHEGANDAMNTIKPLLRTFRAQYQECKANNPNLMLKTPERSMSKLRYYSEPSNMMLAMRCPTYPALLPAAYLAMLIYVTTHGDDQPTNGPIFIIPGEPTLSVRYIANVRSQVKQEHERSSEEFMSLATDWKGFKSYITMTANTGSRERREKMRLEATDADPDAEYLIDIPVGRVLLRSWLATHDKEELMKLVDRIAKPASRMTSASLCAGQQSSYSITSSKSTATP